MNLARRQFLESLGIAAGGAMTAGYTATAKGFAANETITVGCIGTGGRCRRLMQSLAMIPGVKITAVCDIWDYHLDEGRKLAQPDAFATKDYRALVDRKDIVAVVIGTLEHWHVAIANDACGEAKAVSVDQTVPPELLDG